MRQKAIRLGLFGGTFNPVHNGHLQAAQEVDKRISLDQILFIPSYIPPHKTSQDIAPAEHRLEMLRLALAHHPRFVPSALEIEDRQTSYSILTLRKIKKLYPEAVPYFIIGVDAFLEIETWRDYELVLEESNFIVINRPGFNLAEVKRVLAPKWLARTTWMRSGTRLESISVDYSIFLTPIEALPISASRIREMIRQGKSISGLVPSEVERYIYQHHLYQGQNND